MNEKQLFSRLVEAGRVKHLERDCDYLVLEFEDGTKLFLRAEHSGREDDSPILAIHCAWLTTLEVE